MTEKEILLLDYVLFASDLYGKDNVYLDNTTLVIKFEKLHVYKNAKEFHVMHDVYFCLVFDIESKKLKLASTYLWRGKKTYAELLAGYNFSHATRVHSLSNSYSTLCYGYETTMSNLITILRNDVDEDSMKLFIASIKPYLEWESKAGTPFIYFSSIYTTGTYVERVEAIDDSSLISAIKRCPLLVKIVKNSSSVKVEFLNPNDLWIDASSKVEDKYKTNYDSATLEPVLVSEPTNGSITVKDRKSTFEFFGKTVDFELVGETKEAKDSIKVIRLIKKPFFQLALNSIKDRLEKKLLAEEEEIVQKKFFNNEN